MERAQCVSTVVYSELGDDGYLHHDRATFLNEQRRKREHDTMPICDVCDTEWSLEEFCRECECCPDCCEELGCADQRGTPQGDRSWTPRRGRVASRSELK